MSLPRDIMDQHACSLDILSSIFEASPDFIVAINQQFQVLMTNPAWTQELKRVLGLEINVGDGPEEIFAKVPAPMASKLRKMREENIPNWERAFKGECFTIIRDVTTPEFGRNVYEVSYGPLRDAQDEIFGATSISRDITAKTLAEEENARLTADLKLRLNATFDQVAVGIAYIGLDGYWLQMNEKTCQILGYTKEELKARTVFDLTHPDDMAQSREYFQSMLEHGIWEDAALEKRYIRKDGTTVWVELSLAGVQKHDERTPYCIIFIRDITARKKALVDAAEAESMLETVTSSTPVGLWLSDENNTCSFINDYWLEFVGHSFEKIRDEGWTLFVHRDDAERVYGEFMDSFRQRKSCHLEYRVFNQQGETCWIYTQARPYYNAEQKFSGFVGTNVDITEKVRAELEVKKSDQRYRQIVETASEAIWQVDPDYHLQFVNQRACEIFGYSADEMIGKSLRDLIHPESKKKFEGNIKRRKKGITEQTDLAMVAKDGRKLWMMANASPLFDENGTFTGALAMLTDITERKISLDALTESENRFRTIADSAPLTIWMTDTEGMTTYINQHWLDFSGATLEESTGDRWVHLIHPDDRERSLQVYSAAFATRQAYENEFRVRRWDGEYRWGLARANPRYSGDGEFAGYVGSLVDITDRKATESATAESEARLRRLVDTSIMGVMFAKMDGLIEEPNDEFLRMLGYTRADFESADLRWVDLTPPEFLPTDNQKWQEVIEKGECDPYEKQFFHKDGHRVDILIAGALVDMPEPMCITYVLDITERKRAQKALQESEDRYSRVVEGANDGLWDWDLKSDIIYWNDRCYEQLGLDSSLIITSTYYKSLVHPDDKARINTVFEKHLALQEPYELEFRMRHADGTYHWFHTRGKAIYDENGKPFRISGLRRDITDIRQAQRAVRESEERYRLVSRATKDVIWDWDLQSDQVSWNESAYQILGYSEAEISGDAQWWIDHIHPEDRDRVSNGIYDVIKGKEDTWNSEYRFLRGNGDYLSVVDRGYILRDEQGQALRMIGSMQDITARKDYEESLQKKARQQEMVANLGVRALSRLDINSLLQDGVKLIAEVLNANCAKVMELDAPKNLLRAKVTYGWKVHGLNMEIPADNTSFIGFTLQQDEPVIMADIHGDNPFSVTSVLINEKVNSGLAVPIRGYQNAYGVLAVFSYKRRDFSDDDIFFVQSVANIIAMTIERLRFEEMLVSYTRRLKVSNDALQDFASIASHDMKEPLRKIKMFGTRIQDKLAQPQDMDQMHDYLERILKSTDRMQQLIDDLLDYSRVNTKTKPFEYLALKDLIGDVLADYQTTIQETRASIEIDELPMVMADPSQMNQLFHNLIGNALKYRRGNVPPRIKIYTQPHAQQNILDAPAICIVVEDNGIGFDALYQERIFRPFERLHGKSAYPGTGMGLAICQRVVERHGGMIRAESPDESGARFYVVLPLNPPESSEL